jgi:hypothetical protein
MAQRILIATCLVMVLACFGVVGLVWSQSNRANAELAEANRRLAEALGQNQATNQEMLRQMQALAKPAQPTKSAEWIPVTFKLVVEKPDGPPAVGYHVVLGRGHGGTSNNGAIHRESDATGLADFGVVPPGDWEFRISAGGWHATGGLNAVPGTPVSKAVVVPKIPPDRGQVRLRVDWPRSLADKGLIAVALFHPREKTYQPPLRWSTMDSVQLACGPRGERVEVSEPVAFRLDRLPDVDGSPWNRHDEILAKGRVMAYLGSGLSAAGAEPVELDEGRYVLARLLVLRGEPRGNDHELLAMVGTSQQQGEMAASPEGGVMRFDGIPIRPSWQEKLDHLEARPGQVTEWVIPLPEEVARAAEAKLKAQGTEKKPG